MKRETFLHCWWECKFVQPLWTSSTQVSQNMKNRTYNLTESIYSTEIKQRYLTDTWTCHVHWSIIPNTQDMEATLVSIQECLKIWYTSSQSVQLLSHVQLFVTPWTAAHQAFLSITNFWSLVKLMSIESVMPSSHLILFYSPSAFNLDQHQGLFKWVKFSYHVVKISELQLQHQSFQWIFRTDFL